MLACRRNPDHERLRRRTGRAAVRARPVVGRSFLWRLPSAEAPAAGEYGFSVVPPDVTATQRIRLPAGRWSLSLQYLSPGVIRVEGPGLQASLPPYEERGGPYWPVGTVISSGGDVTVSARLRAPAFYARSQPARLGTLVATREERARNVPLREACGSYMDWYELADEDAGRSPLARAGGGEAIPTDRSGNARRAAAGA